MNRPKWTARPDDTWRTALQGISVVGAVEIALHAFFSSEPVLTLVASAVWLAVGFFWAGRGGWGGPAVIAALATLEIVATLFFADEFTSGESVAPWILVVHVAVMAAALVAAVGTMMRRHGRASRAGASPHDREQAHSKPPISHIMSTHADTPTPHGNRRPEHGR